MQSNCVPSQRQIKLAIGSIFKDEAPYIIEWIAYHRAIGVDTFYIADNESSDGTTELLAELDRIGLIRFFPFPNPMGGPPQLPAYMEILRRYRSEIEWISFIDADEFLTPTNNNKNSVKDFIENISRDESVGAIVLNWAIYGSAGLIEQTTDLVIERFRRRAPKEFSENHHYKSIVRTKAMSGVRGTPHAMALFPGYKTVCPTGGDLVHHHKRGEGLSDAVDWSGFRVNHFVVKSRSEFFERKGPKGRATVVGQTKGSEYFRHHDRNEVEDPVHPALVAETRAEMVRLTKALANEEAMHTDSIVDVSLLRAIPGAVDSVSRVGSALSLSGWAILPNGGPVPDFRVQIGNTPYRTSARRVLRPDVKRKIPGAAETCGFLLDIDLDEIDLEKKAFNILACDDGAILRYKIPSNVDIPERDIPTDRIFEVPDAPAMPVECQNRIWELMTRCQCYLEYGTGGTSVKAAEVDMNCYIGVESSAAWLESVRARQRTIEGKQHRYLIHANIGKTAQLGYPESDKSWSQYHNYPLAPWKLCRRNNYYPDLVLVDGRFRLACALASLIFARPGCTIFFDDYVDRPAYHIIESYIPLSSRVDRAVEFVVPANLPKDDLWLAFSDAVSDPS